MLESLTQLGLDVVAIVIGGIILAVFAEYLIVGGWHTHVSFRQEFEVTARLKI